MRKSRLRVPELTELLQARYLSKPVKEGTPFASTREIALRFDVSPLTADRAIRRLVEMGYLYRNSRSGTFYHETRRSVPLIGVASMPSYATPWQEKGLAAAIRVLRAAGVELRFIYYSELADSSVAPELLADLDGLLVFAALLDPHTMHHLNTFRKPLVLTGYDHMYPASFHQVVIDMEDSFDQAVRCIGGEQEIWVVYGDHSNGKYRRDEFLKALKRNALPAGRIRFFSFLLPNQAAQMAIYQQFLDLAPEVRGKFILSTSDLISDTALCALLRHNLLPGRDFDLVSCDNQAKYGFGSPGLPGLTTIDCFREKTNIEAAKLLLEVIRTPGAERRIVRVPTEFIIRETARIKSRAGAGDSHACAAG